MNCQHVPTIWLVREVLSGARRAPLRSRLCFARDQGRVSFWASRACRSSPFSSASSKASGGSLHLVFDTTTPCGSRSVPNRSRRGWKRSSRRSKDSAAPRPESSRFFAPNKMSGSASVGAATSPISIGYSAFHWHPDLNSGSVDPPGSHGALHARCRTPVALHYVR
jgi:hypothetical protein